MKTVTGQTTASSQFITLFITRFTFRTAPTEMAVAKKVYAAHYYKYWNNYYCYKSSVACFALEASNIIVYFLTHIIYMSVKSIKVIHASSSGCIPIIVNVVIYEFLAVLFVLNTVKAHKIQACMLDT